MTSVGLFAYGWGNKYRLPDTKSLGTLTPREDFLFPVWLHRECKVEHMQGKQGRMGAVGGEKGFCRGA